MRAVETRDRALLRAIFEQDPVGAIYMLGDLEDHAFALCRWWTAGDRAVVLQYNGLAVPVVLLFGDVDALRAMVAEIDLPERFYTKLSEDQRAVFERWRLESPVELYAMGLVELGRPEPPGGLSFELVREAAQIASLYDDYPGNFFNPGQVPQGLYAAARVEGEVVAAAGTHAYAPEYAAAALGNVVTAARFRGRGIAAALVRFLCLELLARGVRHIGLHVERANAPAIACYRRIGFAVHTPITQFVAVVPVQTGNGESVPPLR